MLKEELKQSEHGREVKEKEIEGLTSALATASRIATERIEQSNGECSD